MKTCTITLIVIASVLLALILAIGIPTLISDTSNKQTNLKKSIPRKLGASFSVPWIRLVDNDGTPNALNQWSIYPDGSNLYFVNEGNGCNKSRYRFTDQGEIFSECLKHSGDPAYGQPGAGYEPLPAGGFNIPFRSCVSAYTPDSNPPTCFTQDQCKTRTDCLPNQDCLNSICVPTDPTGYAGSLLQIGSWSIFPDRRASPGVMPRPFNFALSFVSSRGLRAKFAMTDIGNLLATCQTGLPVTGFNQITNPSSSNGVCGAPRDTRLYDGYPCDSQNTCFGSAFSCSTPASPVCTVNTDCSGRQNCLGGTCVPGGIGRYADTKITLGGWTIQEVISGVQPNLSSSLQFIAPNGRKFEFQDQGNFVSYNNNGSIRASLALATMSSKSRVCAGGDCFCRNNTPDEAGLIPGIVGVTTFNVSLDQLSETNIKGTGGTYTIMNESGGDVVVSDGNNGDFTVKPNVSVDPPLNVVIKANGSTWIMINWNGSQWKPAIFPGTVLHFPRNGRDPWASVTR